MEHEGIGPIFESFAFAFAGRVRGEGEIAAPHLLDRAKLDASLESLAIVEGVEHSTAYFARSLG